MPNNVSSFLQNYPDGFAHPDRYIVSFTLPKGIPDSGEWMNNESSSGNSFYFERLINNQGAINIGCHTAIMPARTLLVADHKHIGAPFRYPYSQTYDPVSFTFYADKDLNARRYFDIWQTMVINIMDNSMNFWDEYTSDIKITQLDRKGRPGYSVTLYQGFPLSVGDVNFNYASRNEIQNITVTITYKLWKASHDGTKIK